MGEPSCIFLSLCCINNKHFMLLTRFNLCVVLMCCCRMLFLWLTVDPALWTFLNLRDIAVSDQNEDTPIQYSLSIYNSMAFTQIPCMLTIDWKWGGVCMHVCVAFWWNWSKNRKGLCLIKPSMCILFIVTKTINWTGLLVNQLKYHKSIIVIMGSPQNEQQLIFSAHLSKGQWERKHHRDQLWASSLKEEVRKRK